MTIFLVTELGVHRCFCMAVFDSREAARESARSYAAASDGYHRYVVTQAELGKACDEEAEELHEFQRERVGPGGTKLDPTLLPWHQAVPGGVRGA